MPSNAPDSSPVELFNEADSYARLHFAMEEDILRGINYPLLAEQEKSHQAYSRQLKDILGGLLAAPGAFREDVLIFLKNWWMNHILKMDKEYEAYLKS